MADESFSRDADSTFGDPPIPPPTTSPFPAIRGYEILGELGKGGMGIVYKARQREADRVVALKMILAGFADEEARARFRTEAHAVAALQHPNVVQVFDVGDHDGVPFFSLEFCPGGSLDARLRTSPLPAAEAARLVETLARAMHHAHERGVVHRDLKPANVLLTADGTPKVADFGLAKKMDEAGGTETVVAGSPPYMAPEQLSGKSKEIGPATDVYALGAILYECLTGRPPFKAATTWETLQQVLKDEPVSPRQLQPKTPRDLETICLKCLQKEPGQRYASAAALAEDLRRYQAGEPIAARPVGLPGRVARWVWHRPLIAGLGAGLVAAVLVGTAGITVKWLEAEANASKATRNAAREVAARQDAERQKAAALFQAGQAKAAQSAAEQAAQREKAAGEKERIARTAAETATEKARRTAYLRSVALAFGERQSNHLDRVEQLLTDCPPDLRRWEWYYLHSLCRLDLDTYQGHSSSVRGVAFSPDGTFLASAESNGTIKVRDAASGKERFTLRGQANELTALAVSPDGKHLASADSKGSVEVWDARDFEKKPLVLRGHTERVSGLAFSPNGGRLATGSLDATVKIWNLDAGANQDPQTLQVGDGILSLAYNASGDRLATAVWTKAELKLVGEVTIWSVPRQGRPVRLRRFTKEDFGVWTIAYSPGGRWLAMGDITGAVQMWDTNTDDVVLGIGKQGFHVRAVAFSPDGKSMASASEDSTVSVWNVKWLDTVPWETSADYRKLGRIWEQVRQLQTFSERLTLRGHHGGVNCVAFSPDSRRLATGGEDHTVKLWDAEDSRENLVLSHWDDCGLITGLGVSPDGRRVAWPNLDIAGQRAWLVVWDAVEHRMLFTLNGHSCVAIRSDGRFLAAAVGDEVGPGKVGVWDLTTGKPLVWKTAKGEEFHELSGHERAITAVAFSPDGKYLASGSGGDGIIENLYGGGAARKPADVRIWEVETGRLMHTLVGHKQAVTCVAYSPDGRYLATASRDGTVKIWLAATGAEVRTLQGHDGAVLAAAFSPDGRLLATAGSDKTVKLWSVGEWQEARTLKGHSGDILSLAFSPDSQRLASGDNDRAAGEIKVWDAETGEELVTLRGGVGGVTGLVFGPGNRLYSSRHVRTVQVWGGEESPPGE